MQRATIKTSQACDNCRKRKSRCDGRRPACSFCAETGRTCAYRSPEPSDFETAVQSRLDLIETRIHNIETRTITQDSPRTPSVRRIPEAGQLHRLPDFHHGGGHKMLQYWPRLRVKLTLSEIDVLSFIKEFESHDSLMIMSPDLDHFEDSTAFISVLTAALEYLQPTYTQLPLPIYALLTSSEVFGAGPFSETIYGGMQFWHTQPAHDICRQLSLASLLQCGIAIWYCQAPNSSLGERGPVMAQLCFQTALSRLWQAYIEPDEVLLPLTICFAEVLLYTQSQPHAALGILKSIEPTLNKLQGRSANISEPSIQTLDAIFYLLQSDVLSEIDGVPCARVPQGPSYSNSHQQRSPSPNPPVPSPLSSPNQSLNLDPQQTVDLFLKIAIQLRSCTNDILQNMFITDRAFCRPHEVEPFIVKATSELYQLYNSLPPQLRFARDIKSLKLLSPIQSIRLLEISLRYHASIFLLHRPNLYWVLYQDFEEPNSPSSTLFAERQLEPWVLDSCCHCIESAKMIILNLSRGASSSSSLSSPEENSNPNSAHRRPPDWCQVQLLIAAYATLLSLQTATAFSPAFRDIGEIDGLLDMVQDVLESIQARSIGYRKTGEILVNIRQNFYVGSPLSRG